MSVAPKINESQKPIIDQNYCVDHGLLKEKIVYKPFRYPWCYDAWLTQQKNPLVTRRGTTGRRCKRLAKKTNSSRKKSFNTDF